jgi:hypothetical protein
MSFYVGFNRRNVSDRRMLDQGGNIDRSIGDRRRAGSDRYVLVFGDSGIDRFGLMVGFPMALLISTALMGSF